MVILTAAVIVVGVLCLTNLLLTFGVVRRLREHTTMIGKLRGHDMPVIGTGVGEAPGPFTALSTDGELLSGPQGLRVAGFFSSSCSICPERVPLFVDYLRASHIERDRAIAVVIGSGDEPPPYLDRLAQVARVCVEQDDGELAEAFKVTGYPAFCLLDEAGKVLAAGYDPAALPKLAAA
jgi:hypothetical protein